MLSSLRYWFAVPSTPLSRVSQVMLIHAASTCYCNCICPCRAVSVLPLLLVLMWKCTLNLMEVCVYAYALYGGSPLSCLIPHVGERGERLAGKIITVVIEAYIHATC